MRRVATLDLSDYSAFLWSRPVRDTIICIANYCVTGVMLRTTFGVVLACAITEAAP